MNDFPELVLVKLFSFLSLKEVRQLEAVNRHWRAASERYTKERLCVCHPTSAFVDLFDRQDVLLIDQKVDCAAIFRPAIKRGLGKLSLFGSPITADLQNELTCKPEDFGRLKVLSINGLQLNVKEFFLALPGLHTLSLKGFEFNQNLVLNCPNLERLVIHNFRKQTIIINQGKPGKIKFLECQFLNDSFSSLANLEHLVALRIEISLLQFGRLKKLEVYPAWQDFERLVQVAQNEWLRPADISSRCLNIQSLLINGLAYPDDNPINMRLFDLHRVSYQGTEKSLFLGSIQNEYIATNHLKWAANGVSIPFRTHLNYSSLASKFSNQIPDTFFVLFRNIQEVQVHQKVITHNLLTFLRNAKTVHKLAIYESQLEQDLYDCLPSVQSINHLMIQEQTKRICFNFLAKLQRLSSFSLYHFELPWQAVLRAFGRCKYLDQFYFEQRPEHPPEKNSFQVRKVSSNSSFSLELFGKNETRNDTDLETIFNLLNQSGQWNIV